MTQQEFIDAYCARSGVTWEWLSTHRSVVPCDCGEPGCDGWAMVPKDDFLRAVEVKKLPEDGCFVVSDGGTWLPGVYATEQLAWAAAEMDCDDLQAMWDAVLADGRDTVTERDMKGRE